MKRLHIPLKFTCQNFYVHEIAALIYQKLKNVKKLCKPNNRDLNRDWKNYEENQVMKMNKTKVKWKQKQD